MGRQVHAQTVQVVAVTRGAGSLRTQVAIERPTYVSDGAGGQTETWVEQFCEWGEFIWSSGTEREIGGRQAGAVSYKLRLRSNALTRAIRASDRICAIQVGTLYQVVAVDAIGDRASVFVTIEGGTVR